MRPTPPVILNAVKDPVFLWAGCAHPAWHGGRGRPPSSWIPRFTQNDRLRKILGLLLALSTLLLAPCSSASELTDLGQGLGYLRVHELEIAIKPIAGNNALVLDLRHTTATPETVTVFAAALADRAAGSSLFVLVSPDTPADLAVALKGSLVTLGIKGSQPVPQVVVDQTPEADRAAYDALESGTALASLISGKIEKERFDEASLVHEFKNGLPGNPPERGVTGTNPGPAAAGSGAPLTDRVLQRAVHLHRALLALKR